jgi:acetyl-CoA carboxylase biotin carboxyl carrier protein
MSVSSSLDAVKRVIAAFERSDWTEIDVRWGDVRVHLSVEAGVTGTWPSAPATPGASDAGSIFAADDRGTSDPPEPVDPETVEPEAVGPEAVGPATSSMAPAAPPPGAHLVTAPSPGILWRSPQPGAPPFVDLGDRVVQSTTVCIIEVMKLMSHLKAGVSGEVVAVYGENGAAVQKGEPLFAITPSETTS